MKRCRLKRYNFQIRNKMSKENKTSDKQQNGNDFIADVIRLFSDDKLAEIADEQVHISNGCFGELDFTQGKREGFEDGLAYFRDVLLNGL